MHRLHHDILDSTSSEALRLVEDGVRKPPFVVSATQQTGGRGRMGRTWLSPAGGAWFSLAWELKKPVEQYARVPLVAAVAMRRVIEPLLRDPNALRVKWPNDILLDEHKVCGILCEQRFVPFPFIVIGVGVNVTVDVATQLAEHLQTPPTSLHLHTREPVDANAIVTRASDELYAALRAFEESGLDDPANQLLSRDERWNVPPPQARIA